MTESEKRTIKRLWEARVSLEQIYQMLPYTRYQAMKIIKQLRAEGFLKPRKKMGATVKAVASAWETETKNPRELAQMFGLSEKTIREYLVQSGVRQGARPRFNYRHSDKTDAISAEIKNGTRLSEIAKKYGVSRQWVYQIKNKLEGEDEPNKSI